MHQVLPPAAEDDGVVRRGELQVVVVDGGVPVLSARVLDEAGRRPDGGQRRLLGQHELGELGEQMRRPRVGGVDDGSGAHVASLGAHLDPAVRVPLSHLDHGGVGLHIQVSAG